MNQGLARTPEMSPHEPFTNDELIYLSAKVLEASLGDGRGATGYLWEGNSRQISSSTGRAKLPHINDISWRANATVFATVDMALHPLNERMTPAEESAIQCAQDLALRIVFIDTPEGLQLAVPDLKTPFEVSASSIQEPQELEADHPYYKAYWTIPCDQSADPKVITIIQNKQGGIIISPSYGLSSTPVIVSSNRI